MSFYNHHQRPLPSLEQLVAVLPTSARELVTNGHDWALCAGDCHERQVSDPQNRAEHARFWLQCKHHTGNRRAAVCAPNAFWICATLSFLSTSDLSVMLKGGLPEKLASIRGGDDRELIMLNDKGLESVAAFGAKGVMVIVLTRAKKVPEALPGQPGGIASAPCLAACGDRVHDCRRCPVRPGSRPRCTARPGT